MARSGKQLASVGKRPLKAAGEGSGGERIGKRSASVGKQ
jgi:hypothetical protein